MPTGPERHREYVRDELMKHGVVEERIPETDEDEND